MQLEQKKELLSLTKDKYIGIRDVDWELLCLISSEDWNYFIYAFEEYTATKKDMFNILDKAAWVLVLDKIDKEIASTFYWKSEEGDDWEENSD